ncbi:hypothetical protein [Maribellus sediminis]|uniref:hypothetical protein n=1 Tax=Maribellus sediminis TaxID=2696285 RepID=UPI00142F9E2F|nr:hypothetical protein [Maribellus sediminis]
MKRFEKNPSRLIMKGTTFVVVICILSILTNDVQAQTAFNHKVYVRGKGQPEQIPAAVGQVMKDPGGKKIFKIVESSKIDTFQLLKDYTLTETKSQTIKGLNYELKKQQLIEYDKPMTFNKKGVKAERFYLKKGRYKANLSTSKDSILINFWLLEDDKGLTYYDYQDNKIEQKKFLINPETKYFMKLHNRQYESFFYSNYEIAALTIPFKYHFGFTENDIDIDPEFNTNVNISAFLGVRLGRVSYTYDKYKGMIENNWSCTVGCFVGIGSQKLDSLSTSLDKVPLDKEISIPALSYGLGTVFNIKDFNLGVFLGWDNGLGVTGNKWNFDNKPWLGFGFGYKLAFLDKKE